MSATSAAPGVRAVPGYPCTASRRVLPALNEGAFEGVIAMLSPVRGLRPWRAARDFVETRGLEPA